MVLRGDSERSGANAYDLSYDYGPTGNRLVKTDNGALTTYTYNTADELLLVQPPSGQPTTMTWDANGNLSLENTGGSLTTYTWDDENRLTALAEPTAGLSTFAYAPNGPAVSTAEGSTGRQANKKACNAVIAKPMRGAYSWRFTIRTTGSSRISWSNRRWRGIF